MIENVSTLASRLRARAGAKGPVTIGLAGTGQMGTDIVVQLALMPGLRLGAIAEINGPAAIDAALLAGHARSDIVHDRGCKKNQLPRQSPVVAVASAESKASTGSRSLGSSVSANQLDEVLPLLSEWAANRF